MWAPYQSTLKSKFNASSTTLQLNLHICIFHRRYQKLWKGKSLDVAELKQYWQLKCQSQSLHIEYKRLFYFPLYIRPSFAKLLFRSTPQVGAANEQGSSYSCTVRHTKTSQGTVCSFVFVVYKKINNGMPTWPQQTPGTISYIQVYTDTSSTQLSSCINFASLCWFTSVGDFTDSLSVQ